MVNENSFRHVRSRNNIIKMNIHPIKWASHADYKKITELANTHQMMSYILSAPVASTDL